MTALSKVSRISSVVKLHIIEQLRDYQLLILNTLLPILFFSISIFMKYKSNMSATELSTMINSQFFSTSLMLCVVTYSFTFPLVNLVDLKERETLLWIRQSELTLSEFTIGNKISNIIFLNFQSIFIIVIFSFLGYLTLLKVLQMLVIINLTFFVLNSLAFILSRFMKSYSFASNFSSLIMLLFIFSLTFSNLFAVQMNLDLEKIQRFLVINPLFGYYNSMLVLTGSTADYFFKSYLGTSLYLILFIVVTNLTEKKLFNYS